MVHAFFLYSPTHSHILNMGDFVRHMHKKGRPSSPPTGFSTVTLKVSSDIHVGVSTGRRHGHADQGLGAGCFLRHRRGMATLRALSFEAAWFATFKAAGGWTGASRKVCRPPVHSHLACDGQVTSPVTPASIPGMVLCKHRLSSRENSCGVYLRGRCQRGGFANRGSGDANSVGKPQPVVHLRGFRE
jgi:hypothetical protein